MATITVPGDEATIQGAVVRAKDGDRIVVEGESQAAPTLYPERIFFTNRPAKNLTIRAEPRRSVRMYGFNTRGAGEGLHLRGFHTVDSGEEVPYLNHIWSDRVIVEDFYISDAYWAAIYVNPDMLGRMGGIIGDCHIYGCGAGIHTFGDGWQILDNDIERLIRRADNRDTDFMRGFGNDLIVAGNRMHGTVLEEIGKSHVDGFQTFDNNDQYLHGLVYEYNIVDGGHHGMIFESRNGTGNISDISIRNNWFCNLWSHGILIKGGARGVEIKHNLFQDIELHGVRVRDDAEVDVSANIFQRAGSNYWAEATAELTCGYNILDRQGHPYHSALTDLLDVDPILDTDGYPLPGSPAIGAADDGTDIGRIREAAEEPEPEGHHHDDLYPSYSHKHPEYGATIASLLATQDEHEHPEHAEAIAAANANTRELFRAIATANEELAAKIRAKLGEE